MQRIRLATTKTVVLNFKKLQNYWPPSGHFFLPNSCSKLFQRHSETIIFEIL